MPALYILAGCNGAGKTTAAYSLLPDVFITAEFVNAMKLQEGYHHSIQEELLFMQEELCLKG